MPSQTEDLVNRTLAWNAQTPDFSSELAIFSAGLLPAPGLAVIGSDPNFVGAGYDSAVLRFGKFYASNVAGQRRAG
jgi:hypothetical protein